MSRKTKELETRIIELEKKLGNIDKNMEYIRNRIQTAVQIELDSVWQSFTESLCIDKQLNELERQMRKEEE